MGYTHYWTRAKELNARRFAVAKNDCRKLCESLPVPLGDADGQHQPIFSDSEICFNGHIASDQFAKAFDGIPWPDDNAHGFAEDTWCSKTVAGNWFAGDLLRERATEENGDGSYETFYVPRIYEPRDCEAVGNGLYFAFCKTAFRPYDLNVQACLIALSHRFGNQFQVRSDGSDTQWNEARQICESVLGYGAEFRLAE